MRTPSLLSGMLDSVSSVGFLGDPGLFPAGLFALRPADHVLHVAFGLLLTGVGYLGKKSSWSDPAR